MAILVVGGSGKDVGKTALVCAVISALREFEWTAVKITAHDYRSAENESIIGEPLIREEVSAGEETDTERYLAAGARRALLVTRVGDAVPVNEIRSALGGDRNVIFESNRIVDAMKPDVCMALAGGHERKASFERLLRVADAVVILAGTDPDGIPDGVRRFELELEGGPPAEMVEWLRDLLNRANAN